MKKYLILLLIITFFSCKKEEKKISQNTKEIVVDKYKNIYGNWVGNFIVDETQGDDENFVYSNKINIVIKKIDNNKVEGLSIVSGNKRILTGIIKEENGVLDFELTEPGNDKNDGKFYFTISGNELKGNWYANDKKASVISRYFKLTKQKFKYDPTLMLPADGDYVDYFSTKIDSITAKEDSEIEETEYSDTFRFASDVITKINSSTTLLVDEDLKNLKKLELEILRNTIYARHGYSFKKKSYRQFFDPVDWYIPVSDNVTNELTNTERLNINLLERFEKYAEDNYDSFGR